MKFRTGLIFAAGVVLALAGCVQIFAPVADPAAESAEGAPPPGATTVEDFDTTTAAERAAAVSGSRGGREIGHTIASLGNPAMPGFWLKTPLVSVPTRGRILYRATGKSVAVDLIPTGAATGSSRISLAALRLLGVPLTGLPELIVYAG